MLAVYGDADAMRWVGDGEPITHEACVKWLEVTENNYRVRGYGMFALVNRKTQEVLGFCGLVHPGGPTRGRDQVRAEGDRTGDQGLRRKPLVQCSPTAQQNIDLPK